MITRVKYLDLLSNSQLILKENVHMEVSLDNLYVDTGAYRGLNREFTTLPNFLLVLKVLLICFFSDFNPSKRICRTTFLYRPHPCQKWKSLNDDRFSYIPAETMEEIF